MLLCVEAAWAKRISLSLKLSSHWRPCKLPRTEKKGKKEVTKLTMKVITRCIRALRRYQKTKNKTNVTEFETGDSLVALAERCKLCLNCKRTSEKCQRQQRKTAVAVSTLHEIILCGARIDNSDGGWIFAGHDEFSMAKLGGP